MHQFNSAQSAAGRVESFKAEHRPDDPLDGPVILLDQVVQVFDLADLDGLSGFLLERPKGDGVGPALVDRDLVRKAVVVNRFAQKPQRGLLVTLGAEQKINRLPCFIHGAEEVLPLAPDLDVRLVRSPALANWAFLLISERRLQLRCELLDPTIDARMVDLHAALFHHLFQIPIAERIGQVPAHTGQDDVLFKSVAFKLTLSTPVDNYLNFLDLIFLAQNSRKK